MAKKTEKLSLEEMLEQALVKDEDRPYEVPENWVWVRLGDIADFIDYRGKTPNKTKSGIRLITAKNIKDGFISLEPEEFINEEDYEKWMTRGIPEYGDVIITTEAPLGNVAQLELDEKFALAQRAITFRLKDKIIKTYLKYVLMSPQIQELLVENSTGTTVKGIKASRLKEIPLPLPNLKEQQRIATIIDRQFEKLDRAKELVQNVIDSFENRKSAILHKAFTGELTAKWREENKVDEPEHFYNLIKEQRISWAKSSRDKDEINLLFDEHKIEDIMLENSWIKLKAAMFCDNITCGKTPTGNIAEEGDVPFLKVYNIVDDKIDFNYKPQFIDNGTHTGKLKSSTLIPGDVIMNIVGPPLRKIAIIPNDYPEWNMNQAIVRFRPVEYVDNKYLYYCLINKETLDEVISETKGVVGQANISVTQSRNLEIPIPSIQEQQEIVRILDFLLEKEQSAMQLVDLIENIDHMKKSILARAFRGEVGTNNPEEESALELLKQILQGNLN